MKNKAFLFVVAAAILIIVALFMFRVDVEKMILVDRFSDTSEHAIMVFSFVEVENYSKKEILKFSENIIKEIELGRNNSSEALIAINYYYKLSDTIPLDRKTRRVIRRNFRQVNDPELKLQQVENAYQYIAAIGDWTGKAKPQDSLFQTTVVVPRKGFNAKNLMKVTKKKKAPIIDTNQVKKQIDTLAEEKK
jgi:hypothetical protein